MSFYNVFYGSYLTLSNKTHGDSYFVGYGKNKHVFVENVSG
jgi:hypothetical protein